MTIQRRPRTFKVDARALLSLGRESIKDHTTALVELVKNSYDADAENVDVEILADGLDGIIRVADDGVGMTSKDIDSKWLRIGFSEKRKKKISSKGRRETGEKGIGRLSADRLGAAFELRSMSSRGKPVGIGVSWDEFDVDDAEVGTIPVADLPEGQPNLPKHGPKKAVTGTEIRITELRQAWSQSDISELENELATLVPSAGVSDFSIWIKSAESDKFRRVESLFEGAAELEFEGAFSPNGLLRYKVSERPATSGKPRRVVEKGAIPFSQLAPGASNYRIGNVQISLSYFLRRPVDIEDGFTLGQLREYLNTFGGVRIYRDHIRVKPYGNPAHPEGDWLGLADRKSRNPAGAGRGDFRIASNQLVGGVYIGRDTNPRLSDSAAREGLVHGEAFATLRSAVFGCVVLLESIYHRRFVEKKQESTPQIRLPTVVEDIKASISDIRKSLSRAEIGSATGTSRLLRESVARVELLATQVTAAEKEIDELASQATVYRGLATVGISAAVFGHETESALGLAKASSALALEAITQDEPDVQECEEELSKAVGAIDKVAIWGQFALARVKKDKRKRTKLDVSLLLERLVKDMRPLFASSSIELERKIDPDLELRGFAMDVEALLLNLLTNAFHAAGRMTKDRRVLVRVRARTKAGKRNAIEIVVSDSGHGIAKQHLERIWAPLFSTKVDNKGKSVGTGLGLTIVRSIVSDLNAVVSVEPKGLLGGATFSVSIPIEG